MILNPQILALIIQMLSLSHQLIT